MSCHEALNWLGDGFRLNSDIPRLRMMFCACHNRLFALSLSSDRFAVHGSHLCCYYRVKYVDNLAVEGQYLN